MALRFSFDPRSIASVRQALNGVKYGVTNRVVKAAIGKQARAAAKEAKADAPRGPSGELKRSIGSVYKNYKQSAVWVYVIGPRKGFEGVHPAVGANGQVVFRRHVPTKIAHLAEKGRGEVTVKTAKWLAFVTLKGSPKRKRKLDTVRFAKKVGKVAGTHFMEKAYNRLVLKKPQIATDIEAGIKREAAKYAAKGKSIYG